MGRSTTPKYAVKMFYRTPDGRIRCDEYLWVGRPNAERLENMRKAFNQSFQPGGVNFHISESNGYIPHYFRAQICRNVANGAVVEEVNAPMFEVA